MNSPSNKQAAVEGVKVGRDAHINVEQKIERSLQLSPYEKADVSERKKLLTAFRRFWLHLLEGHQEKISLKLKTRFDLVRNPFSDQQAQIDKSDENTGIEQIFNQWSDGQRLLILGEPGAGKTITLLQLAKKFRDAIKENTEKNILKKMIPVVFHLSSWKCEQSLEKWLIQELTTKYRFPQKTAEDWVQKRERLLFLLDGFDQVKDEYQQKCAEMINEFNESNIVVCSRSQQYEALPKDKRLNFSHVVCIEPLTNAQIDAYLEKSNKPDLKQTLEKDKELGELVKIPFWLEIITDVDESLPGEGSSEDRKKELFDQYIKKGFEQAEKRFKQEEDEKCNKKKMRYSEEKIRRWLTWLASKSEPVFLIEEIQPSWLVKYQKRLYLATILCMGMLIGLLLGVPYGLIVHFYVSYSWGLSQVFLKGGIVLGIAAGGIIGTAAQYFLKVHKQPIKTHKNVNLSLQNLCSLEKTLDPLRRSLQEGIVIGALVFFFCLLILPILDRLTSNSYETVVYLWMGLVVGAFFGLVTLISRLSSIIYVESKKVKTVEPNQGILDSRKKAYLIAKTTLIIFAIFNTLMVLIIHHHDIYEDFGKLVVTLILGLCSAVLTGGTVAFIHDSGKTCQQHLALRIVLYLTDSIPWNYRDFLEYASEPDGLRFLNRIGGGYQFFHDLFKQHLISQKQN